MPTPAELNRKIEKLLAVLERRLSALFHLPKRIININEAGNEQVVYETPYNQRLKGVAYKVYIASPDWDPDWDGIDL